ncbi:MULTISPECIES: hypothetical protein [Microbacterium]|jgi:hypothetical protein|uniref:Uncharacterized protein n=2 Tax=Microbacterium maritypicum TaxID=33918 RepID=A0A4Y4BBC7_MICMQ|nr:MULTISPECIES: hypothetical protein [Microbacterium]KQY77862.1 hypothetical protein ASD13_04145 [Microbacterium sp. Root1433D1]QYG12720.1 hypothetical protein KY497_05510 [Microbacterium sp. PAMC22086]GEC76137.1 hypothetical protein MLI01_22820 [Microbacterium liquefaciens]GGV59680.1 hypothetical protein GCM10010213_22490 [Microbacterium liquefaciens]
MVFEERNAWAGLILTPLVMIVYVVLVLQDAGGGPLTDVDWFPLMLWVIGGGIVVTIAVTIGWGLIAGIKDPDGVGRSDIRDRDISRMGGRVEQGFVVIAGLGVIALCAVGADVFWIANTMFAGFAVSAFIGCIARVIAYRRGLV